MHYRRCAATFSVSAVTVFLILAISPRFARAVGETSDTGAAGAGGCNPEQTYDPNLKFPEKNTETGKIGLIGLPCHDTTDGYTTQGTCVAADKCEANNPQGQPTQQQTAQNSPCQPGSNNCLSQDSAVAPPPSSIDVACQPGSNNCLSQDSAVAPPPSSIDVACQPGSNNCLSQDSPIIFSALSTLPMQQWLPGPESTDNSSANSPLGPQYGPAPVAAADQLSSPTFNPDYPQPNTTELSPIQQLLLSIDQFFSNLFH
jgi:hypothetical protein